MGTCIKTNVSFSNDRTIRLSFHPSNHFHKFKSISQLISPAVRIDEISDWKTRRTLVKLLKQHFIVFIYFKLFIYFYGVFFCKECEDFHFMQDEIAIKRNMMKISSLRPPIYIWGFLRTFQSITRIVNQPKGKIFLKKAK